MALLATMFAGCNDDEGTFDNKIYIDAVSKTSTIFLKGEDTDNARFQVAMPKTEGRDITFTIAADASLVSTYNEAYYDNAILLPAANYTISSKEVTISAGSVRSSDIAINFKELTDLDRQQKFVLPVSISSSDVDVLQSARTMYYVVRGAALINVVADIEENNLYVDWVNPDDFRAMRKFTAEALIRARDFNELNTVMGIEGKFLIRIGDAGLASNQLQIATSVGGFTSTDLAIPMDEWTHIAVTYDADATTLNVFINGRNLYTSTSANIGAVDWGVPYVTLANETDANRCFRIGYSYADNRYLAGQIAECRIWNKVLTVNDINELNYFYYVDPASAGLIAYWKFDDGGGSIVKDHSYNGNDAASTNPLTWVTVELPVE